MEPPELAQLLDFAERPREGDWSLRAALTRYAQPEPERVGNLLEVVRRVEAAVRPHLKAIERDGARLWAALDGESRPDGGDDPAVGLLHVMAELDAVGDELAAWAVDPTTRDRPDAAVDAAVASLGEQLDRLGVPREQRQRPPRGRTG